MSTKIYDAYRLPDRTDPFALARTLGEEMMPVHRRLTLDALVAAAGTLRRNEDAGSDDPFADAAQDLCLLVPDQVFEATIAARRRASARRARGAVEELVRIGSELALRFHVCEAVDLQFQVVLLGDTGPGGTGGLYAKIYTSRGEYRDAFVTATGARDFEYWNNTDPAEGVGDEEWDVRRDTWERLLGEDAPARRGLTWELPTTGFGLSMIMFEAMPDLADALVERGVSFVPTGGWRGWLAGPLGGGAR